MVKPVAWGFFHHILKKDAASHTQSNVLPIPFPTGNARDSYFASNNMISLLLAMKADIASAERGACWIRARS